MTTDPDRRVLIGSLLVADLLSAMAAEQPVFRNEAAFEERFAQCVRRLDPEVRVTPQHAAFPDGSNRKLDLLLARPGVGDRVAVELKYVTRALSVTVGGGLIELKAHSAQDQRRYDFVKDVVRLEELVAGRVVDRGWAFLLTNDQGYWRDSGRASVDAAFRLHEGRLLRGALGWSAAAGAGTTRDREAQLHLTGRYSMRWDDFSTVSTRPGGTFRVLAVQVTGDGNATIEAVPPVVRAVTAQHPEAAKLQAMIDELRRMRDRCEPKSNQNPAYLRYSNAVSALLWLLSHPDG